MADRRVDDGGDRADRGGQVDACGREPDGEQPADRRDRQIVPPEAGRARERVEPGDDEALDQQAEHDAADDEDRALHCVQRQKFGHGSIPRPRLTRRAPPPRLTGPLLRGSP